MNQDTNPLWINNQDVSDSEVGIIRNGVIKSTQYLGILSNAFRIVFLSSHIWLTHLFQVSELPDAEVLSHLEPPQALLRVKVP